MARRVLLGLCCMAIGAVVGAALDIHADGPTEEERALAAEANVHVQDAIAAVATVSEARGAPVGLRTYLEDAGHLERPRPPAPVFSANVMARVACLEAKESGGANVWNRGGSGAGGVLQYMEISFRRSAAEMGHPEWSRWVPWQARLVAAHDLIHGRRAQWTVSGC